MFSHEKLKRFCKEIFLTMGCPQEHAETAADVLVTADLRGVDSHGVVRLSGYVRLWEIGRVNANPNIKVVHETASTALIDGDRGLGLVVGPEAMKIAIDKANQAGTGWVAVKNSNHYGIAGYHAMLALEHDMIGITMTNASAHVAPTFSVERLLGTNPISVAVPAGKEPPFVADFATTPVAYGKIEMYQRKGEPVPLGWLQDEKGCPTTNAYATHEGGALVPLGGDREHGSHKGYCLGAIVDIFSAVLSGANYGPWVPPFPAYLPVPENPVGQGIGHFLGAMRIDAFRPADEFKANMDTWIRRFRRSKPAQGHKRVLIPGDPEAETMEKRKSRGIPLLESVVEDLKGVADKFGIKF
ncbi:MAG: Ldh family oxidoreductase [Deltaproteobacteria bacterium]|nr:Ldh family oxidoreductase [Deltaproteobacteria bacterium]